MFPVVLPYQHIISSTMQQVTMVMTPQGPQVMLMPMMAPSSNPQLIQPQQQQPQMMPIMMMMPPCGAQMSPPDISIATTTQREHPGSCQNSTVSWRNYSKKKGRSLYDETGAVVCFHCGRGGHKALYCDHNPNCRAEAADVCTVHGRRRRLKCLDAETKQCCADSPCRVPRPTV